MSNGVPPPMYIPPLPTSPLPSPPPTPPPPPPTSTQQLVARFDSLSTALIRLCTALLESHNSTSNLMIQSANEVNQRLDDIESNNRIAERWQNINEQSNVDGRITFDARLIGINNRLIDLERRRDTRTHDVIECPVCYTQIGATSMYVNILCGHILCNSCRIQMIENVSHVPRCPTCRETFDMILIRV